VIDAINAELAPMRERAREFENSPDTIRSILERGAETASAIAEDTLRDVRAAMGLAYR
jgi:tryptophanyl-tRNA synthetase